MSFRVFVGAPSRKDWAKTAQSSYQWETFTSSGTETAGSPAFLLPPATLEAASRRISLIYQNIIFDEAIEYQDDQEVGIDDTLITWPSTAGEETRGEHLVLADPSFLVDSGSSTRENITIDTQNEDSMSYNYSDASSIGRFPSFQFSLHRLTSLASLSKGGKARKVSVVLAVLEVEGPNTIRIKKGVDAGKDVSILKMILGDEEGNVCRLTAWREVAESLGGVGDGPATKRGDVVYIENVMASCNSAISQAPTMTASPYLNSKLEICFRTMPYSHEDKRLRPDLRLGSSDVAVRKVATLVAWFERTAGL